MGGGDFYREGWINLDFANEHYNWNSRGFIEYDISKKERLPFDDESVDIIYISHVIEHLENHHVIFLVSEIFRCLRKSGVFRVAVPNADLFYFSVVRGDPSPILFRNKFFKSHGVAFESGVTGLEPIPYLIREIATPRSFVWSLPGQHRRYSNNTENTYFIDTEKAKEKLEILSKSEFYDYLCNDLSFRPQHAGDHINWWNYDKIAQFLTRGGFENILVSSFLGSVTLQMREWPHFDSTRPMMSLYVEAIK